MAIRPDFHSSLLDTRLQVLEGKIRLYDPEFKIDDIVKALGFVGERRKSGAHDDLFSRQPLLILEHLLEYANPDRATMLAAVLYPSFRPLDKRASADFDSLKRIEQMFGNPDLGRSVRIIVEDTLRFRAWKFEESGPDEDLSKSERKQARDEYLRLWRLMGLWLTRGPRAILMYGTQIAINLQEEIDHRGKFKKAKLDYMIKFVRLIAAPLAYIAGYEKLREKLLDLCFRAEDPNGYSETRRAIEEVIRRKETESVKAAIVHQIQKDFPDWQPGIDFEVEIRPKPAASAREKAERKEQKIAELGDLCAMRVILRKSAVPWAQDLDVNMLDAPDRRYLHDELGRKCMHVYGQLSKAFGRGNFVKDRERPVLDGKGRQVFAQGKPQINYYSYRQERFAELARIEPREKDPGRYDDDPGRKEWEEKKYPKYMDAHFDDYINRPKVTDYSSVQDKLIIFLPEREKPVEVECQIVDEYRHEHNMKGPGPGRVYYKSGLAKYTSNVVEFYRLANRPLTQRKYYKGPQTVMVFDEATKKVVDVSDDPTLKGFFKKTRRKSSSQARVYNGHEFAANEYATYGRGTRLISGCRIKVLAA